MRFFSGRLRIPVGLFVLFILCLALPVLAGDQLVIAEGSGWSTIGFAPEVCQIYPCIEGFARRTFTTGFYTAPASTETSFTFLKYGSTSFFVPPVGELKTKQVFEPVVSDPSFVTTVNVFATAPASLLIGIGGTTERCEVVPPVTQCAVSTRFDVGSITLEKALSVGFNGSADTKVYGFVAWGARDGGTAKVLPFVE